MIVLKTTAIAYGNACLSQMNVTGLQSLLDAIGDANIEIGESIGITESIQKRITELQSANPLDAPVPVASWREELLEIVQMLVHPLDIDWMEDDDDQRYVQHALDDIVAFYKSSVIICSVYYKF